MSYKIGLLTFSYSENSGSLLQAYALKTFIESNFLGYSVSIINYQKEGSLKPKLKGNHFFDWLKKYLRFKKRTKKHFKFLKKYLKINPSKTIKKNELSELNEIFDYFLVGSDQVWNVNSPKVDETYFLNFVNDKRKKISYAASFGTMPIVDNVFPYSDLLASFSFTSVREKEGINIFKSITGMDTKFVLDPSFLLNDEDYDKILIKPEEKKFLVLYLLEPIGENENKINDFASKNNLQVVKIWRSRIVDQSGNDLRIIGPEEWLGYMKYAKCIVTNSFHGICFSIIFKKNFLSFLRNNDKDLRLKNILSLFSLENRLISEFIGIEDYNNINYDEVYTILNNKRNESVAFLKEALNYVR